VCLSSGARTGKRAKRAGVVSATALASGKTGPAKLVGRAHPTWLGTVALAGVLITVARARRKRDKALA
jgi:hypothetical protein